MSPGYDDMSMRGGSPSVGSADGFELHHYSYANGAEDAANELEESLLGAGRIKNKLPRKRAAAGESSDDSSEADIPIAARHGPLSKKRKLAKGPTPGSLESHTHTLYPQDMASMTGTIPLPLKSHLSNKGKGKGKQREGSIESASTATPRGRKKPGPKKTLLSQTQEALSLDMTSASASRDITPSASRAPSPTLTNEPSTFYDLDDTIPALKKARRIDDAGMWKRVRALEEAQRKVWTSIAKRDVVKVS